MGRFLAGGIAAMLLVAAGLFWWQGRASREADLPVAPRDAMADLSVPDGDGNAFGPPPPMPASATPQSREQRRFDRYDRNRDEIISRVEMMGSRAKAFRDLDKDGNNLLTFEEWAVATSDRFGVADANRDAKLTRAEFATTAPKVKVKPKCGC